MVEYMLIIRGRTNLLLSILLQLSFLFPAVVWFPYTVRDGSGEVLDLKFVKFTVSVIEVQT